ncbi:hypothetical protein [Paenibacillus ginsengihumi]|mgnify:CR=1 FL=1|nr:hypothetical protein [Paenibacillus ginsengihumi]
MENVLGRRHTFAMFICPLMSDDKYQGSDAGTAGGSGPASKIEGG